MGEFGSRILSLIYSVTDPGLVLLEFLAVLGENDDDRI